MSATLQLDLLGAGIWARGIRHFDALTGADTIAAEAAWEPPAPAAIPPKERRRAGTFINLAVEVAHQACELAGVDKSCIPSVFTSGMGDTQITDYMCRKLLGAEKLLSPTQFHNSVHNAASGYWTISASNRAPSTFVGGFDRSFGAGLFEAAAQALAFGEPVLLVCYDITTIDPLRDIRRIDEPVGLALVLAPVVQHRSTPPLARLTLSHRTGTGTAPLPAGRIPAALLQGAPQPDALLLLDAIAGLVRGEYSALDSSVPMPRDGHLAIRLSRVA